ncbi:MAG TPA: DUF4833 domain-containing protein [Polyangiaceae bacterium]
MAPYFPRSRPLALLTVFAAGLCLTPSTAAATEPTFFPFDVQTVFFISKSDDKNRVDYGIHLDEHCIPQKDDAVFAYWREFENAPPVRLHTLGMFDFIGYGISEQRTVRKTPNGGYHVVRLRQFSKAPIGIFTKKEADGHCSSEARTLIRGKEAIFASVFVKLAKGGLAPSVEYIDIHGKDPDSGQEVAERIYK